MRGNSNKIHNQSKRLIRISVVLYLVSFLIFALQGHIKYFPLVIMSILLMFIAAICSGLASLKDGLLSIFNPYYDDCINDDDYKEIEEMITSFKREIQEGME